MTEIVDYDSLKTAVAEWMHRSNLTGMASTFIQLAEAKLNRVLPPVEQDNTALVATVGSRRIDVSSLNVIQATGLWNTYYDGDDILIPKKADGSFRYNDTSQAPSVFAMDENNDYIDLDSPADIAYTFRFRYKGRFALSDSVTTNQLLTDHPDVYLAAVVIWGNLYTRNTQRVQTLKFLLDEHIAETRHYMAMQDRQSSASVDSGLLSIGGRGGYNINYD